MNPAAWLTRAARADPDRAAIFHGERVWSRQDMAELLASPGAVGWVVQSAEAAIGFLQGDHIGVIRYRNIRLQTAK